MAKQENNKQAASRWEDYIKNLQRATPTPIDESVFEKEKRIKKLLGNYAEFSKYYFPNYTTAEFAKFQLDFAKQIINNDTIYAVGAWAREHAKSVNSGLFTALFLVFNGKVKNMLLVSNSEDKAKELLAPIWLNLEFNHRLINDFGVQKGYRHWEEGKFITTKGVSFRALGAGQSPRGSRNEEKRPDFILIDDIDIDEESRNQARIDRKFEWIEQALFPAMSISGSKRFVFIGNIISKNSIIVKASKVADFYQQVNILDKQGKPSWSERYTLEDVNYMLSKISYASGQKEYFNNPISEGSVFKELKYDKIPPLSKFKFLVCYTDPSFKDSAKNDYKATVLVGEINGVYYIIKAFVEQTTTAKMIQWHKDLQLFVGEKTTIYYYIESNFLQDIFLDEFRKNAPEINIQGDDRKKPDKFTRIEANLEPLNRTGRLVFNEAEIKNPHLQRLEAQFKSIEPNLRGGHDDGPDAAEGAVWIISHKLKRLEPIRVHQASKGQKNRY